MAEFKRSKREVEKSLKRALNKILEEVDVNHAFDKTIDKPKVTGIAGDVVEKSVLGYPSNSSQEPDLMVDGVPMEVKTTGIRYTKKSLKKKKQTDKDFEAKEPMTVTAVSPNTIVKEKFDSSNFWDKLNHLLMVYYHYDSLKPVKSWEYKGFYLKGYDFHSFSATDKKRLESDWAKVRSFIVTAQKDYPQNPESRYPYLGSTLRKDLLMIDTAPKWPNHPRFRLKRSVVSAMVQECFGKKEYEVLPRQLDKFSEIDAMLHECVINYQGLSIRDLLKKLDVEYTLNKKGDVTKSICERVFLKMIGAKSKKLNKVDIFRKAGIILKNIVETSSGKRTEDMKMFPIDFDEMTEELEFSDSQFFDYFNDTQFIFIVFRETDAGNKLLDNQFIGFKRYVFSDTFIDNQVKRAWEHTKGLYLDKEIEEKVKLDKKGKPVFNRSGGPQMVLNFIKSRENEVFVRGGGSNARTGKTLKIQNISMYQQYIWVKGLYLVNSLEKFHLFR